MPHLTLPRLIVVLWMIVGWIPAAESRAADIKDAVVQITVYRLVDGSSTPTLVSQGSGFLVDTSGLIVTAKHVLDDFPQLPGKRTYTVTFASRALVFKAYKFQECPPESDLCLLAIGTQDARVAGVTEAVKVLCRRPVADDTVTSYGFAPGDFSLATPHEGKILSDRADKNLYPASVQIIAGMSGGPVVWNDYAIAVNHGAEGINYAFVEALYRGASLLQSADVPCPRTSEAVPANKSMVGSQAPDDHNAGAPQLGAQPAVGAGVTGTPGASLGIDTATEPFPLAPQNPPGFYSLEASADGKTASCRPVKRKIFADPVGPDTGTLPHPFTHKMIADPGCDFASYEAEPGGDAEIGRYDFAPGPGILDVNYVVKASPGVRRVATLTIDATQVPMSSSSAANPLAAGVATDVGDPSPKAVADIPAPWAAPRSQPPVATVPDTAPVPDVAALVTPKLPTICSGLTCTTPHPTAPKVPSVPLASRCRTKVITIDRVVGPLWNEPQSSEFQVNAFSDPGCAIVSARVGDLLISAPGQHIELEYSSLTATISYGFRSTRSQNGRLKFQVFVQQERALLMTGAGTGSFR